MEHRQESGWGSDLAERTFIRFELFCVWRLQGCGKFTSGLKAAVFAFGTGLKVGREGRIMNVSHPDCPTPSGREDKLASVIVHTADSSGSGASAFKEQKDTALGSPQLTEYCEKINI